MSSGVGQIVTTAASSKTNSSKMEMSCDQKHRYQKVQVSRKPRPAEIFLYLLFFYFLMGCGTAQGNRKTNKKSEMLGSLMQSEGNNNKVPPNFDADLPTLVTCHIYVDSFDSISEASMDYTVSIMMALSWVQPNLKYQYEVEFFEIDNDNMKKIWIPDLYFPNEKKASFHQVMNPNQMMRLYPDGRLEYFARLSLTLSCPMNLRNYPFDRQECALKVESFGFDADKLILEWVAGTPVDINRDIELPQFQVVGYESGDCDTRDRGYSRIGNHSCLEATFHMERSLQYYLIQMYIPSALIVIVSWLSFWLTVGAVAGRTSLGVLTVLTMTTQSSSVNASLPRVSYIKAIDLWMSTCLVFVFSALIEFAIVNVLSRRKGDHGFGPVPPPPPPPAPRPLENGPSTSTAAIMRSIDTIETDSQDPEADMEKGTLIRETLVDLDGRTQLVNQRQTKRMEVERKCCTSMQAAVMLDRVSRVAFPFFFASFCTCYWSYYAYFTDTSLSYPDSLNETELVFD